MPSLLTTISDTSSYFTDISTFSIGVCSDAGGCWCWVTPPILIPVSGSSKEFADLSFAPTNLCYDKVEIVDGYGFISVADCR